MGRLGWAWVGAFGIAATALYTDLQTNFEHILFQRSGGVVGGIGIVVAILKFRHWRPTGNETVADKIFRAMGQPTPVERARRKFEFRKLVSAVALGLLGTLIATFGDVAKVMLMPENPDAAETQAVDPPSQGVVTSNAQSPAIGDQGQATSSSASPTSNTNASGRRR